MDKVAAAPMDSYPDPQALQKSGLVSLCGAGRRDFTGEILVIQKVRLSLALALYLYRSKRVDTAIMESRIRGRCPPRSALPATGTSARLRTAIEGRAKLFFRWIAMLSSGEGLSNIVPLAEKEMNV